MHVGGDAGEGAVAVDLLADVVDEGDDGGEDGGVVLLFADEFFECGLNVAGEGGGVVVILLERGGDLGGDGYEGLYFLGAHGVVERVGGGDGADEDEHDEAHAFLAVVGTVGVGDAAAGEDKEAADVEGWRGGAFRGLVEAGVAGEELEEEEDERGADEADDGRDEERFEDLGDLLPIDAGGAVVALHELVGDADAEDGTNHGVGGGGGQALPPGGEVPEDSGDEEGEDHGEAGTLADLEDELDGEEGDDGKGDGAAAKEDADEVHAAGVDDGDVGVEGVGVDAGGDGVGGIVEAVDELKAERDEEGDAEQEVREEAGGGGDGEVCEEAVEDVGEAAEEEDAEDHHADAVAAFVAHFLIEQGCVGG